MLKRKERLEAEISSKGMGSEKEINVANVSTNVWIWWSKSIELLNLSKYVTTYEWSTVDTYVWRIVGTYVWGIVGVDTYIGYV